jgi:hypothetical protein
MLKHVTDEWAQFTCLPFEETLHVYKLYTNFQYLVIYLVIPC